MLGSSSCAVIVNQIIYTKSTLKYVAIGEDKSRTPFSTTTFPKFVILHFPNVLSLNFHVFKSYIKFCSECCVVVCL